MTSTTSKALTSAEKRELTGLVKRRFELMKSEIKQRKVEIVRDVTAQLREKQSQKLIRYSRKLDALRAKAAKLEEDGEKLYAEAKADGITFGHWRHDGTFYPKGSDALVTANVASSSSVEVDGIEDQIQRVSSELSINGGRAGVTLERMEVDLLEELVTSSLTSDEGRAFLARIPSLDDLVTAATQKAISA